MVNLYVCYKFMLTAAVIDVYHSSMGEERETLTIRQAATLLGVHPNTVRNRIKTGVYQAEKIVTERGETYIIPRSELTQDLTTNIVPSASHSQSLPDVREAMQAMLEPFVRGLGNVREELGRERERREHAERRIEELERQLETRQEPQNQAEPRPDRVETPPETTRPAEGRAGPLWHNADAAPEDPPRRPWWRRWFGG